MARTKYPSPVSKQVDAVPFRDGHMPALAVERISPTEEIGVAGVKISSGFVHDEFLPQLIGRRGRRIYREMRDNDATVSSILFAIEMLLRAVEWRVEYDEGDQEESVPATEGVERLGSRTINDAESAVNFIEGVLFDDMDHTWQEFIAQVMSMLTFGWQYTEVVYKRRMGPDATAPEHNSIFNDGLIGIRKLADRSQETLDRWDVDENGNVNGLWQEPPNGGALRYIPMERALLFRPTSFKDSPEGRSAIRGAYRSWFMLKNMQEIEAIAIERELNGLPVCYIPNDILNGKTPEAIAARAQYERLVRDIKFNEQGGVLLPSNPYYDADGKPLNIKQVELTLLNAEGRRAIDINSTIVRYQRDIARTVLADFIMLGQGDRGSFALSKNKTDLFVRALEGWLESVATVINRHLIPKIWTINALDPLWTPYVAPGRVAPEDLDELGNFVQRLAAAGFTLFDEDTENRLRDAGGLPEKPIDAMEEEMGAGMPAAPGVEEEETELEA